MSSERYLPHRYGLNVALARHRDALRDLLDTSSPIGSVAEELMNDPREFIDGNRLEHIWSAAGDIADIIGRTNEAEHAIAYRALWFAAGTAELVAPTGRFDVFTVFDTYLEMLHASDNPYRIVHKDVETFLRSRQAVHRHIRENITNINVWPYDESLSMGERSVAEDEDDRFTYEVMAVSFMLVERQMAESFYADGINSFLNATQKR